MHTGLPAASDLDPVTFSSDLRPRKQFSFTHRQESDRAKSLEHIGIPRAFLFATRRKLKKFGFAEEA
jgi:hypothetical protein